MTRFWKQVVLVTGASSGIGYTIAERFAQEGANIAALSNNKDELLQMEQQFKEQGHSIMTLEADVADPIQVEAAVGRVIATWGQIDILANNAGVAWEESFLTIKDDNWKKMLDINLNGMFYVAQRVAKYMTKQGRGVIINMSSTNGLVGEVNYAHYNASKGGIVLLTKTMALELGKYGIRVNAVCPGYIQTPMSEAIDDAAFVNDYITNHIPIGRVGKPKDVAGVFAFLASEDAAFITGTTIVVDGGQLAF